MSFLVLAQYLGGLEGIEPSLFSKRHLRVFGPYDPAPEGRVATPDDALQMFIQENCAAPRDAQRFFAQVQVIEIAEASDRNLRQAFGELIKFPDPGRFSEVDYYFLRGDQFE